MQSHNTLWSFEIRLNRNGGNEVFQRGFPQDGAVLLR